MRGMVKIGDGEGGAEFNLGKCMLASFCDI